LNESLLPSHLDSLPSFRPSSLPPALTSLSKPTLRHLPGQYIDLYIPDVDTVGGFTITSAPQTCLHSTSSSTTTVSDPYIELAIQNSPTNPPAAYLWRPIPEILHNPISFRVGGTFVFPPSTLSKYECEKINNVILIAGGVGVNPIMSMLSAMDKHGVRYFDGKPAFARGENVGGMRERVRVLYSSKRVGEEKILFEERLKEVAKRWEGSKDVDLEFTLFETGDGKEENDDGNVRHRKGRIAHEDLFKALGGEEEVDRERSVVYVCGVPQMTDEFVELLSKQKGMDERRVLCEKWW
jgi:hypothetical protein